VLVVIVAYDKRYPMISGTKLGRPKQKEHGIDAEQAFHADRD
jgi:hypothetical protein